MAYYDDPYKTEKPSLFDLIGNDMAINNAKNVSQEMWDSMNDLQKASILTTPVPLLPDVLGLAGDAQMYMQEPETRSPVNYGLSLAGALPFIPMAGILAGRKAQTLDPRTLALAEKMKSAGRNRNDIWKETGEQFGQPAYFDEVDNSFRWEIDDSGSKLLSDGLSDFHNKANLVRQNRMMSHKGLSEAYPDSDQIRYIKGNSPGASYNPARDEISLPQDAGHPDMFPESRDKFTKSPALHELNHAIQQREGFARGGSPSAITNPKVAAITKKIDDMEKSANYNYSEMQALLAEKMRLISEMELSPHQQYEQYERLLGEADSRAVQARMDMNMQDRINTPFWESYDVPEDELIRMYRDGDMSSVLSGAR